MIKQVRLLDHFHAQISGPDSNMENLGRPPKKWVFLHGLMGSLNNWRTTISKIEQNDECLVYDQRGHGRSFKPETGYTVDDYADDLKKILDELNWERIILVGHSMGGRNALRFADKYSHYLEKLVIEDIGPEPLLGNERYYEKLLAAVPTPFSNLAEARQFFKGPFQERAAIRGNADHVALFLNANIEEKPDGTASWRFSEKAIRETVSKGLQLDQWREVKSLKVDTLFIRGENSVEFSTEVYDRVLESNKIIQGVIIPHSGHWVHADQPDKFLIELQRFVG